jgi:hypothetical protein
MWRPCETILDKPAKIFMCEGQDVGCFLALTLVVGIPYDLLGAVLVAAGITVGLYRLRRGKAAGYLLHQGHRWGLLRLPGVLSRHPTCYKVW